MRKNLLNNVSCKIIYATLLICTALMSSYHLSAQPVDSIIFNDDFDRDTLGSSWTASPFWSIVGGSAYNFQDGTGGALTTTNGFEDSSYIIETEARGFTTNYRRNFSLTFGGIGLGNDSMYVLTYNSNWGSRLTLSRSSTSLYEAISLDEAAIYPILNSTQNYKFKIAKYKSGLIQVYLDSGKGYGIEPLLESIDSSYIKLGHFGWREDTEGYPESFYVNWINAHRPSIEKLTKEKPKEDELITQVSAESGKSYKVAKLIRGVKQYIDRDYTITSIPSYLEGASFIQTAMDDKTNASQTFLTSFIKKNAIIFVGYDPRGKTMPAWLSSWTKTSDRIGTNDQGSNYLEIYSKKVDGWETYPYPTVIGGNLASPASGSQMNYLVAAVVQPDTKNLQAEDAFIVGPVKANNHVGFQGSGFADFVNPTKDYVEWTVQIDIPGIYNFGFTYANGHKKDRPLLITNDGNQVEVLSFSSTGSWDSWSFLNGPNVFLCSGVHKIRATATGLSGPNMDQLSLYYSSSSASVNQQKATSRKAEVSVVGTVNKVYPNPFIESATIRYMLQEKTHVSLSIYTIAGQPLEVLVDEIQQPGTYLKIFNANRYSKGLYYYRLQVGSNLQVGKLIKAR